jgi:hypothetical protein
MPRSFSNQITIEKTANYFVNGLVPRRVYEMNRNIKLIIAVRNPVKRTLSHFFHIQSRNKISNIEVFMQNNNLLLQRMIYTANETKSLNKDSIFLKLGIYIDHLKQWLKYFPIEQFFFLNGESLIKDPSIEINKLQDFLGIERLIKKEHFVMNKKKGFSCINMSFNKTKCLSNEKGHRHPRIDPTIVRDLENFYEPYNKAFFNLIEQEPFW